MMEVKKINYYLQYIIMNNLKNLALLSLIGGRNKSKPKNRSIEFDYFFYHANCRDGTCSLWCAYYYNDNDFIKVSLPAGTDPDFNKYNFKNKKIIFADVCPSIYFLLKLSKIANHVTVIDHHDTNLTKYNKIKTNSPSNLEMIFDMDKSACMMTWDYFFNKKERPWFIDRIGDRDLFKNKIKKNEEFIRAIDYMEILNPDNLKEIDKLSSYNDKQKKDMFELGENVNMVVRKIIEKEASYSLEATFKVDNIKYNVWVGNIKSDLISDLGNYLAHKKFSNGKNPDFVILWNYRPKSNAWNISLRGNKNSPKLSTIAEKFGGGGHPLAAAFRLTNGKNLQSIGIVF